MRAANLTDGVILDSTWYCLPTDFIDPIASAVVLDSEAYKCYEPSVVPTFVLHGEKDRIISPQGAREYARRNPTVTACFAEGAGHTAALTEACLSEMNTWIDATFGWDSVPSRHQLGLAMTKGYMLVDELNTRLVDTLPEFVLDLFVRGCRSASPVEAYQNGCSDELEV
jgi:hypothetical protein